MKLLLLALSLLISAQALAQMSAEEQLVKVEDIAKTERRHMWRNGYQGVDSSVEKMTKARLDEILLDNSTFENPLSRPEVSSLYRCFHSTACSLFLIDVVGSMYGGDGNHFLWILLNPETGKYRFIRHSVYEE